MNQQRQRLLHHWFSELWMAGNIDLLDAITTDNFVSHAPGGTGAKRDREEYQRSMRWYHQIFHDPTWQIEDVIEAGQKIRIRYMNEGATTHPMHLHSISRLTFAKDGWNLPQPYMK